MDLLKSNNVIVHLGGASIMATQIVSNAQSAGLDVAYDFPTLGDGNCFYRAVIQQMQRTQIKQFLHSNLIFTDSNKLRIAVVMCCVSHINKIFISSSTNITMSNFLHEENENMSWLLFLHHQANNATYAT